MKKFFSKLKYCRVAAVIVFVMLFSCEKEVTLPLQIVTSVAPVASLVQSLGGEFVEVSSLAEESSADKLTLNFQALNNLKHADKQIFINEQEIQALMNINSAWDKKILSDKKLILLSDMTESASFIYNIQGGSESRKDLYAWLSPQRLNSMAFSITKMLIETVPDNEASFVRFSQDWNVQYAALLQRVLSEQNALKLVLADEGVAVFNENVAFSDLAVLLGISMTYGSAKELDRRYQSTLKNSSFSYVFTNKKHPALTVRQYQTNVWQANYFASMNGFLQASIDYRQSLQ